MNDNNKTSFIFLFPGISGRNFWSSEGYFKLFQTEESRENPNIPSYFWVHRFPVVEGFIFKSGWDREDLSMLKAGGQLTGLIAKCLHNSYFEQGW